jgi:hypothetical protein
MQSGPSDDLPSAAVFPETIADFERAGSPARQAALREKAWTMLETWTFADGFSTGRLANAWLGERDWRVQFMWQRDLWLPERVDALAAAAARRGVPYLLGCAVGPRETDRSAVWRVPVTGDGIARFCASHYVSFALLFPEDLAFALHGWEGDLAMLAGPEPFLRDALAHGDIGPAALAEAITASDPRATEDDYAAALAPFRPFMLE